MRLHHFPPALICLTGAILTRSVTAGIIPNPFEQPPSLEDQQDVQKRCSNPCGYYGQLCCESNQYCYTDSNNEAQCGTSQTTATATTTVQSGNWVYYTTTYVETDLQTITTVYSSYEPITTETTTTVSCLYSQGETSCGSCCCSSGQYCASAGVCKTVSGGGSSGYYSSLVTVTTLVTQSATAPARVTSNSVTTVTSTGSATTTESYQTPVGTSGIIVGSQSTSSGGGLSGGAIAGIVIGVIVGIIILLLCCACFCFKEIFDGILDLFGLGKRRTRRETEIIEERRSSRHRTGGRTWFGTRPSRPARSDDGGGRGLLAVGGLLAGLAVILGLKRRRDRKDEKSSVSGYSYYDDEYSSSSSSSSGSRPTRGHGRVPSESSRRSRSRVSRR